MYPNSKLPPQHCFRLQSPFDSRSSLWMYTSTTLWLWRKLLLLPPTFGAASCSISMMSFVLIRCRQILRTLAVASLSLRKNFARATLLGKLQEQCWAGCWIRWLGQSAYLHIVRSAWPHCCPPCSLHSPAPSPNGIVCLANYAVWFSPFQAVKACSPPFRPNFNAIVSYRRVAPSNCPNLRYSVSNNGNSLLSPLPIAQRPSLTSFQGRRTSSAPATLRGREWEAFGSPLPWRRTPLPLCGASSFPRRSLLLWCRRPIRRAPSITPCWNSLPRLPMKPSCAPFPRPTHSPPLPVPTIHRQWRGSVVPPLPPKGRCPHCFIYAPDYGGPTASMLRLHPFPVLTMC